MSLQEKRRHQSLPAYFEHQLSDKPITTYQKQVDKARKSTEEESVSTLIRIWDRHVLASTLNSTTHYRSHTRNKGVTDRLKEEPDRQAGSELASRVIYANAMHRDRGGRDHGKSRDIDVILPLVHGTANRYFR